jgi:hypothetical protein
MIPQKVWQGFVKNHHPWPTFAVGDVSVVTWVVQF